jgi:hypothetical protein
LYFAVDLVVLEVIDLEALQFSTGLQQFLVEFLQLVFLLTEIFALSLDLALQLLILALERIGLLDQLLNVTLDLVHLVIHEPHVAFLLLAVLDQLPDGFHLVLVRRLHLLNHLQDDLAALAVPVPLLTGHQLVVLLDALESLLQDGDALLGKELSVLPSAWGTDVGGGVV